VSAACESAEPVKFSPQCWVPTERSFRRCVEEKFRFRSAIRGFRPFNCQVFAIAVAANAQQDFGLKAMRYEDIKQGFHVISEGNKWIAVGPEFVDLKESVVGFGDTPLEAISQWMRRWSADPRSWWQHSPRPGDFRAHEDGGLEDELEHQPPTFLL
jgi:hypothetical protein